jgi:hypothetical protein
MAERTDEFRRPTSRVIVDLVATPIGALAFLGFAIFLLLGGFPTRDPYTWLGTRVLGPLVFGFFGLLMAAGVPMMLRRGFRAVVLRIGPEGIWTPEMGQLAWVQIAEVRHESIRGFSGDDSDSAAAGGTWYGRIGIVPTDPERTAQVRRSLVWRMFSGFIGLVKRMRPSVQVEDPDQMAPYGIYEYEISRPLEEVIASVERFRPVTPMPDAPAATG